MLRTTQIRDGSVRVFYSRPRLARAAAVVLGVAEARLVCVYVKGRGVGSPRLTAA